MQILILPVSATCSSTAIYPDAERVIWMRRAWNHRWGNWDMNLPSNCWLFCVTRNSHFRRALASVVLKFNKESDRKTPFERRKIYFFKSTLPTAIFGINSSRVTVSDHFYWFLFIKSVNITFYLAKVCFFPYLLLIKIVKYTCWEFQMLKCNNKTANDINSSKHNSRIKKHEYFYNMYSFIPLHYQNLIK
jgi:hypothetical protein